MTENKWIEKKNVRHFVYTYKIFNDVDRNRRNHDRHDQNMLIIYRLRHWADNLRKHLRRKRSQNMPFPNMVVHVPACTRTLNIGIQYTKVGQNP